jgi:hypothetical protein
MKPVNAITVIAGTSSVPRNEVSQGPRRELRQSSGRNGDVNGRSERWERSSGGRQARPVAVRSGFGDFVTDKLTPDPRSSCSDRIRRSAKGLEPDNTSAPHLNGQGSRFLPVMCSEAPQETLETTRCFDVDARGPNAIEKTTLTRFYAARSRLCRRPSI